MLSDFDKKMRHGCVSSTRVAPILGLSTYQQAIDVLHDLKYPDDVVYDDTDSIDALMGREGEAFALRIYSALTGRTVQESEGRHHASYPWISSTPDGYSYLDERGDDDDVRVLEVKCPRFRDGWGESGSQVIPAKHTVQCIWHMAVHDVQACDVVAWFGSRDLRIYTIDRDKKLEQGIIDRISEWRERYVLGDEMLPPDGTEAYTHYLTRHLRERDKETVVDDDPELGIACARMATLKISIDAMKQQREKIKQTIALKIGYSTRLHTGDWHVSYPEVRSKKVNWEAYARVLGGTDDDAKKHITIGRPSRRMTIKKKNT